MKRTVKLLALLLALCLLLSLGALADGFNAVITYDASAMGLGEVEITVDGQVDSNGNVTIEKVSALGMDVTSMLTDELRAELTEYLLANGVYDVDAARQAALGITAADSGSASGEASGASGEASGSAEVTYDVYVDESAAYESYDFDGSTMGAHEGYLTVTVGGVEYAPEDLNGTYKDVVFTVTDALPAIVDGYSVAYRTALFIDADGVEEDCSVLDAVLAGSYDDEKAEGLRVESYGPAFNGLIFKDADYTVDGLTMVAEGNGVNDFCGFGAGVAVGGTSHVTINNYEFIAKGVIRHGMFVGGDDTSDRAELTINGGIILAGNPADEDGNTPYTSESGMSMSSSPWMLGIEATPEVRTQLMASSGVANYNDCVLISSGWGIVSSDAVDGPANWGDYTIEMNLTDCVLDFTGTSGYVSYAIGATHNSFVDCIIGDAIGSGVLDDTINYVKSEYDYDLGYEAAVEPVDGRVYNNTYALIVANETSGGTFDGTTYTGQYGVMYHKTNNVRYVPGATDNSADVYAEDGYTLVRDSSFYTNGAAFLVKACTPVITVENSLFQSRSGVIVQLMTCDDPGMGHSYFSESLDLDAPVEADPDYDPYDYNTKNQSIFSYQIENMVNDVQADFADCKGETALNGNFFNSISVSTTGEGMTWFGQNLICSFDNCEINGLVSSSRALHDAYSGYYDADGNAVEAATTEEAIAKGAVEGRIESADATYLGCLSNTPCAPVNNGVWAVLKNGSVWNVPGTCYLTVLDVDESSTINGVVTVDGQPVDVSGGGRWTGSIVVEPGPGADALHVLDIDGDQYVSVDDLFEFLGQ